MPVWSLIRIRSFISHIESCVSQQQKLYLPNHFDCFTLTILPMMTQPTFNVNVNIFSLLYSSTDSQWFCFSSFSFPQILMHAIQYLFIKDVNIPTPLTVNLAPTRWKTKWLESMRYPIAYYWTHIIIKITTNKVCFGLSLSLNMIYINFPWPILPIFVLRLLLHFLSPFLKSVNDFMIASRNQRKFMSCFASVRSVKSNEIIKKNASSEFRRKWKTHK